MRDTTPDQEWPPGPQRPTTTKESSWSLSLVVRPHVPSGEVLALELAEAHDGQQAHGESLELDLDIDDVETLSPSGERASFELEVGNASVDLALA